MTSSRTRSWPGKRPWPAATAPAMAAPSRSTASCSDSASQARAGGRVILNASGCLDALEAPEVARALDVFVTKTVTPQPREGNPPVRIAETEAGMLNSIGLENPGIEALLAEKLPRLARARSAALGLGRRFRGRATTPSSVRALDDRQEVTAIELNLSCPNVEEAPETRRRARRRGRAADPESRSTRSSRRPPRTSRRPPAPSRPRAPTGSRS